MALVNGLIGTGTAAAAAPYQAIGAASHTLESIMYDLCSQWKVPFIALSGKSDRTTSSQRFAVASYYQDDPINNTSGTTIMNPVVTVSEQTSTIAQAPVAFNTEQSFNVVQLVTATVGATYLSESSSDKLTPLSVAPVANEGRTQSILADQIMRKLRVVARWMERSALYQTYQEPTSPTVMGKTRGIISLMSQTVAQPNTLEVPNDVTGTELQDAIETLIVAMDINGAEFTRPVLMCSPLTAKLISQAYATNTNPITLLDQDRFLAGWNYNLIITSVGVLPVIRNRFMVNDDLLLVDFDKVGNVWLPVPGKGNLFVEELAKRGAASELMIYGQWGLDHGLWNHHGYIKFVAP